MLKRLRRQRGFTLIEVIIALGLLGVISIAFLSALAVASSSIIISDERATADSLARSEMEYVKRQDYSSAPWSYELPSGTSPTEEFPTWWDEGNPHTLPQGYEGYTVTVVADLLDPAGDGKDSDDGLQQITITITHIDEDAVIILAGYNTG